MSPCLLVQSVLYRNSQLQHGWAEAHFGRNQLSPGMIGLLPLGPSQRNTLKGSYPTDLHGSKTPTSSYSGLDHPASGLAAVTTGAVRTTCLIACAPVAFAPASCLSTVSLATAVNSLPLYPTGTLQPWIDLLTTTVLRQLRFGGRLLGRSIPWLLDFGFFSRPSRDSYQFSLAVLFRYRSQNIFRVRSRWLLVSQRNLNLWYSGNHTISSACVYGTMV